MCALNTTELFMLNYPNMYFYIFFAISEIDEEGTRSVEQIIKIK